MPVDEFEYLCKHGLSYDSPIKLFCYNQSLSL